MEYTSQGQGTLNTVLGAVGTYGTLFNGGLSGIFGGNGMTGANGQNTIQNIMDVIDLKTENAILKASLDVNDKIKAVESRIDGVAAAQAVANCGFSSSIAVLQNQTAQLMSLTKIAIPNANICPGWGTATVSVSTSTTTE